MILKMAVNRLQKVNKFTAILQNSAKNHKTVNISNLGLLVYDNIHVSKKT
jgi:hypothetical protein